jgi:hypothetical protein
MVRVQFINPKTGRRTGVTKVCNTLAEAVSIKEGRGPLLAAAAARQAETARLRSAMARHAPQ